MPSGSLADMFAHKPAHCGPIVAILLATLSSACSSSAIPTGAEPVGVAMRDAITAVDLPQQSNQAQAYYSAWQQQFVMQGPCAADELYVSSLGDAAKPGDISVSEAMGYGLLITALMADVDAQAQATFDKMLNFVVRRSVDSGLPLMTWRIDGSCQAPSGETSATDGELDIALALLYAAHLWPAGGAHDYATLAQLRIAAVMQHIVQDHDGAHPVLGLWEDIEPGSKFRRAFRLSDIMPRHFRIFAAATGDTRWLKLLEEAQRDTQRVQQHSPLGLVPDFAVVTGHAHEVLPVPPHFLEKRGDGAYSFNACRTPLRLGHEVATSADSPFVPQLRALALGLKHLSHNDPAQLAGGYELSGLALSEDTNLGAFVAPLAAGLFALDAGAAAGGPYLVGLATFDPTEPYYSNTLRMLALAQLGM